MSQDYLDKLIEKDKAGTQIQSIPLHDTELRGITIDDPITVEGNPINFSTKNEQNAISSIIDISPIQDLHGYSKPWVGGAGKNLLPLTVEGIKEINTGSTWNDNSYTYNGVTFTILTDEDNNVIGIKAHGQNNGTAASLLRVAKYSIPSGSYILTSCPSGGSTTTYYADWRRDDGTQLIDTGNGVNYTSSNGQTDKYSQVIICVGYNAQNIIYSPILRKSTDPAGFEPYTNICPILPHEEIKIGGCGKNLLASQIIELNGTTYFRTTADTLLKAGTYTMSMYNDSNKTVKMIADKIVNGTTTTISTTDILTKTRGNIVFTLTEPAIIKISGRYSTAETITDLTVFKEFQIEVGNQATNFESYKQSNSLTLPLPENVYGGTLNLETGELVVSRVIQKLIDQTLSLSNTQNNEDKRIRWTPNPAVKITASTDDKVAKSNVLIEAKPWETYGYIQKFDYALSGDTSGNYLDAYCSSLQTIADWTKFAIDNDVQICYELATPYILQLTPAQLKLFKDVNNLNSSDYTTLTVTYHSNSMATLTPATDTTDGLLSAMDKHKLNTYDIADIGSDDGMTVEDNPLMITTRSDQHALSTKVNLAPIQDLHGFTKPWVGGAGKNILPMVLADIKSANTNGTWSGNVYTYNNVTFTVLIDDDINVIGIKANGTASGGNSDFILSSMTLVSGNILNGSSGGSLSTYGIAIQGYGISNTDGDYTITSETAGSKTVYIRVSNGKQVTNQIFYPMIRLSTEPNPTFEPYTNICSISGLDEIDILGCGVNLAKPINDNADVNGIKYANQTDGKLKVSGTASAYSYSESNSFTLKSGSYIISKNKSDGNRTSLTIRYASDGTAIAEVLGTEVMPFTLTSDTEVKIRVAVPSGKVVDSVLEPMVRFASDADSTFEPYTQSNNLSLPLPETVYGGELDLESGELKVTHNIVDLGTLGFTYYAASSGSPNRFAKSFTTIMKDACELVCENYESRTKLTSTDNYVISSQSGWLTIVNLSYGSDATSLNASLSGYKVVYELLDTLKYTIHLTPEQLTLFKDINHISTNAKSISVTYREGKLAINSPATDTTDGLLSAIDKRALDRTEEIVEGNPIAFETESIQVAKSTIVDLEPIQDLHGFSKPWVGGAGKNLLPLTVDSVKALNNAGTWSGNEYTHTNGMKFTLLVDSDNNLIGIKANGTFNSSGGTFVLYNSSFTSGSYHIRNLCTATISGGEHTLQATPVGSSTTIYVGTNSGSDITISAMVYIRMAFGANVTLNNVTFTPLLVKQSVTDYTFEPYTNIAAISGRSEVDILGCGKNLAELDNITLVNGSFINSVFTNTNTDTKSPFNLYVYTYKDNVALYSPVWNINISSSGRKTFTMDLNYDYDYLYIKHNGSTRDIGIKIPMKYKGNVTLSLTFDSCDPTTIGGIVIRDIMINAGSQATPYSPYTESTSLQIQLGQTVYGGQLDVENGILVIDREYAQIDSVNGVYNSTNNRYITSLTNISKPDAVEKYSEINCINDKFESISLGGAVTSGVVGVYANASNIGISGFKTSLADYKSWLTNNPVTVCYKIATPTTISLTPEQVKLLQGVNIITTNADNITLTYRNGSVATLNDLESLYAKLKAYIDSLHSS